MQGGLSTPLTSSQTLPPSQYAGFSPSSDLTAALDQSKAVRQALSLPATPTKTNNPPASPAGAGLATGLGIDPVRLQRQVSEEVQHDLLTQTSALQKMIAESDAVSLIESLLGQTADSLSLPHLLQELRLQLELLNRSPNPAALLPATVTATTQITSLLQSVGEAFQSLRQQANESLARDLEEANNELALIRELNDLLVATGRAAGNPQSRAEQSSAKQRREAALRNLAKYLNFSYFQAADGSLPLFTANPAGKQPIALSLLELTPEGGVSAGGTAISEHLTSGSLGSALALRDTLLPNLQAQVDILALQWQIQLNQVHNRGIADCVNGTLTGTRIFISPTTQTLRITGGDSIIALVDSQNRVSDSTSVNSLMQEAGYSARGVAQDWTITALVETLNRWVGRQLGIAGDYLSVAADGPVMIRLPASGGQSLAFRDIRTLVFESAPQADPNRALALGPGSLFISDNSKTLTIPVTPSDSLNSLSDSINRTAQANDMALQAGLSASNSGSLLRMVSATALDLIITEAPDLSLAPNSPSSLITGLGLKPSGLNMAADTTVVLTSGLAPHGHSECMIAGFSHFFGFNDLLVSPHRQAVHDSTILSKTFATSNALTIGFFDSTGQLGPICALPEGTALGLTAQALNVLYTTTSSQQVAGDFAATAAILTITANNHPLCSLAIEAGANLSSIVEAIQNDANLVAGGVRIVLAKRGDQSWLRLYGESGERIGASMSPMIPTDDSASGLLTFAPYQEISAAIIGEGAGQRLRLRSTSESELVVGGSLAREVRLTPSALDRAATLAVRPDIVQTPALISLRALQCDPATGAVTLPVGDLTMARHFAFALRQPAPFPLAGQMRVGNFTMYDYANATLSAVMQQAAALRAQAESQSSLQQSLARLAQGGQTLVLDREIANLTAYQQAYSASAWVISTMKASIEVLTGQIR